MVGIIIGILNLGIESMRGIDDVLRFLCFVVGWF